jgi:uncharacterized protein YbcI
MSATNRETAASGVMTAAISNSMVGLLHRYTGRGQTRARTTIGENIIVCVMGATLTKGEQTLVHDGKSEVVLHSRRAFQDTIQAEAISAVQELSRRRVLAFMSNNHIDPDPGGRGFHPRTGGQRQPPRSACRRAWSRPSWKRSLPRGSADLSRAG